MSRRGWRITVALATVVALLFAGRWTAAVLADRWWAEQISPAAAAFLTEWHLLRLTLDVAGVVLAASWFIGHLLIVYRAIGSVQVPGNVGNVEFRETVRPRVLLAAAVVLGAVLGLIVGSGLSNSWQVVALAWQGVRYALAEPLLGHGVGVYVAQLPLWRLAHGFALLLVLLGIAGVLTLYVVIGAVRWIDGRPAINDHARTHLGWLFAATALTLAWGYLLEPYELVAGLGGAVDPSTFRSVSLVAPALAGTALMVAIVSALWALRPRHLIALSGWLVLIVASAAGHYVLPALSGPDDAPPTDQITMRRLEAAAFGLAPLEESRVPLQESGPRPTVVPSLWHEELARAAVVTAAESVVTTGHVVLDLGPVRRPAWLVGRTAGDGRTTVVALADDRVGADGGPLFYRPGDTVAYTAPQPFDTLSPHAVRPGAPRYEVDPVARGVLVGGAVRRITLAWALQAAPLLAELPAGTRVAWRLEPVERLRRLAPFAQWTPPEPRIVGGRLLWLSHGYVTSRSFPLVTRVPRADGAVSSLRAGFLGVVTAETGAVDVFLREPADPIAEAWADIAGGLVRLPAELPDSIRRAEPYPEALFRVQAGLLAEWPWLAGALTRRLDPTDPDSARQIVSWQADSTGPRLSAAFERSGERRIESLLFGRRGVAKDELMLVRIDSAAAPAAPAPLVDRWQKFPLFTQLGDSAKTESGTVVHGPVRYWADGGTIGAYQPTFSVHPNGRPALIWMSLAVGEQLGAGRSLDEAWQNLRGEAISTPPTVQRRSTLEEARRWMRVADSALGRRDWTAFGRAFDALRDLLAPGGDSVPR